MSLTAYERETVILMSDGDDTALITTWQKPLITKLRRNPAAEIVEIQHDSGSTGVTFRLPAKLISVRNPRQLNEETREKLAENARKAREAVREAVTEDHQSVMQQPLVTRMEMF
jgi:hypothetical protein